MKKLKFSKMQTNGQEALTREQLRNVLGGTMPVSTGGEDGCCCAHTYEGPYDIYDCGLSKSEAQQRALELAMTYGNGKWCCDSCPTGFGC